VEQFVFTYLLFAHAFYCSVMFIFHLILHSLAKVAGATDPRGKKAHSSVSSSIGAGDTTSNSSDYRGASHLAT